MILEAFIVGSLIGIALIMAGNVIADAIKAYTRCYHSWRQWEREKMREYDKQTKDDLGL